VHIKSEALVDNRKFTLPYYHLAPSIRIYSLRKSEKSFTFFWYSGRVWQRDTQTGSPSLISEKAFHSMLLCWRPVKKQSQFANGSSNRHDIPPTTMCACFCRSVSLRYCLSSIPTSSAILSSGSDNESLVPADDVTSPEYLTVHAYSS